MASLNEWNGIGRVGQVPEIVTFKDGNKIAKFSLATSRKWKDRDGGEHEDTQWHNIIVGGKGADVIEQYVDKGQMLYVKGELTYRAWEDNNGGKHRETEIRCTNFQLLGGKPQEQQTAQRNQRAKGRPASKPVDAYEASNDGSDDLPFGSSRARR